jgi:hypothetical protein
MRLLLVSLPTPVEKYHYFIPQAVLILQPNSHHGNEQGNISPLSFNGRS